MKLSFIGGGAMAEAIIRGVLSASLAKQEDIYVGEISESRCRYLTDEYRIYASPNNAKAAAKGDLVVLSVKPQNFQDVAPELKEILTEKQTALSIIAGAADVNADGRVGPRGGNTSDAQHAGPDRRRHDHVALLGVG